jgi:predicted O-methyltransferase YrrM
MVSDLLDPQHETLEVGGGQSTVLFAAAVKRHVCINPDRTSNDLIQNYLTEHDLARDNVEFLAESSDDALPRIDRERRFDVALLDGNHSFPFPMVDFHYTDRLLRRGSFLVLDNVEINAVKVVADFLRGEPAYKLVRRASHKPGYNCHVYQKLDDLVTIGWSEQSMNQRPLFRLALDSATTLGWTQLSRFKNRRKK